jgi:Ca-activated chloride channel family protein
MKFATPLPLLGLLALPALAAWYLTRLRAQRLASATFTTAALLGAVVPRPPGWRRHAPFAACAVALAAIVLAAAHPHVTTSAAVRHLQTMLALDMSGSMQARDVLPNRASAAQRAADTFVGGVPAGVGVGVMQFNQTPQVLALPSRSHGAALAALGRLHIGGGTAIGAAIETALAILAPQARGATTARTDAARPAAAIVLLSDGKSTSGPDAIAAARAARAQDIPIFTVALGTANGTIAANRRGGGTVTVPVPVEGGQLAQIARAAGGQAYTAADAQRLSTIYRRLGARLSHRRAQHDLTPYLLGAGLFALLLGCSASLAWFGRLA